MSGSNPTNKKRTRTGEHNIRKLRNKNNNTNQSTASEHPTSTHPTSPQRYAAPADGCPTSVKGANTRLLAGVAETPSAYLASISCFLYRIVEDTQETAVWKHKNPIGTAILLTIEHCQHERGLSVQWKQVLISATLTVHATRTCFPHLLGSEGFFFKGWGKLFREGDSLSFATQDCTELKMPSHFSPFFFGGGGEKSLYDRP